MIEVPWPTKDSPLLMLDGENEAWYRDVRSRATAVEPGPIRTALVNEARTILDMIWLLDARPVDAPALPGPMSGISPERALQTAALMDDMEADGFQFPQAVKDQMRAGQLSINDATPRLLETLPDFDGTTYQRALDHERLGAQLLRVGKLMGDGRWRTLAEISAATGDPEASVSARLRDLRKRKFGGHTVERERIDSGLWKYRVVLEAYARPWDDAGEAEAASA